MYIVFITFCRKKNHKFVTRFDSDEAILEILKINAMTLSQHILQMKFSFVVSCIMRVSPIINVLFWGLNETIGNKSQEINEYDKKL